MRYILIIVIALSIFRISNGQEVTDQIKGTWIINKFQSAGPYGITYQLSEFFIGDTVIISNTIRHSLEENEYTRAAGISPVRCKFNPIKKRRIDDPDKYFYDKFQIKPIVLGIKDVSQVFLINTDCIDDFFKEIYFDATNDKLFLFSDGMFFILDRIENK